MARDGLAYVLLCDIGWAKWALSTGLALCTLTGVDRDVRADVCRAEEVWCVRYCYPERRVVRSHCSEYRHTGY